MRRGEIRLMEWAAARRHFPALITPEYTISYDRFFQLLQKTRVRLQEIGVQPQERVAIVSANGPEMVILIWALWAAGAVAAPLSIRLPEAALVSRLQQISAARLILGRGYSPPPQAPAPIDLQNIVRLEDADASGDNALPTLALDRDASIIFTSGSAGLPKGALHTVGNHYYSALGANENLPLSPGDRWLLSLPLYHAGGLAVLMRTMLAGAAVALAPAGLPLSEAISRLRITHVSLVATQLQRWMREAHSDEAAGSLKAVLLGGSAFPQGLIEEAQQRGLPLYRSYGSTEMASQIAAGSPRDGSAPGSSGKVLRYRELKISPDGEILVRGKTLFRGYWQSGKVKTQRLPGGWFATGDMGHIDEQGNLWVSGRRDNMFISGGENIQPEEIEMHLGEFPEVEQAVVVGIDHPEYGRRPVAFVAMRTAAQWDEEALRRKLAERLPRFKIPDSFWPWPHEPAGNSLKVDRRYFEELARRLREAGS